MTGASGMTSDLAREDLEDLRAEGLTPTDEDVIRLHALALKISDGPETTAFNAPRWATAGGVVFWEPTMAARYWYGYAKQFAADAETEDVFFAFACAKGRERGYLDALRDREAIERAVRGFAESFTGTPQEMERAVYYAAVGVDEAEPEKTGIQKQREAEEAKWTDREQRNFANLEEILARAAAATGLTFDDIMVQTPSRLRGMIYAAHVQAGMQMTKVSAKAHADYLATLDAIAKRLRAEKAARDTKNCLQKKSCDNGENENHNNETP